MEAAHSSETSEGITTAQCKRLKIQLILPFPDYKKKSVCKEVFIKTLMPSQEEDS
jgi:hypothetical protein